MSCYPGAPCGLTRFALTVRSPSLPQPAERFAGVACSRGSGTRFDKDCGDTAMIGVEKPAVEAAPATCLILIVEDDPLVASYIRDVLEESGFSVIGTASSGPEAMALVGEVTPA